MIIIYQLLSKLPGTIINASHVWSHLIFYSNPMRMALLFSLFCKWRNWITERLSCLPLCPVVSWPWVQACSKVSHGGAGISTYAIWLECPLLITLHYTEENAQMQHRKIKNGNMKDEHLQDSMWRFIVHV